MTVKNRILGHSTSPDNMSIVMLDNGSVKTYNVNKTHPNFTKIQAKVGVFNAEGLSDLINISQAITNWGAKAATDGSSTDGVVSVKNGNVYFNNEVVNNGLTRRILKLIADGQSADVLMKFMVKVQKNPSYTSRQELFDFLEGNNLPFTPTGNFLAYKAVRDDYKDIHSASCDNSVGQVLSMERGSVDDNRERTCSTGYHFSSMDYAKGFGRSTSRMMILEIDPSDVVSIPVDYKRQKGRTCKYTVIGEVDMGRIQAGGVDVLEQHAVIDTQAFTAQTQTKNESFEQFLSRKAQGQRRDSSGRFLKSA